MDDEFFELPDEGAQSSSAANNLLNSSIFGAKKSNASKSIDSILASLPGKTDSSSVPKKPSVSFQDSASPRFVSEQAEPTAVAGIPKSTEQRGPTSASRADPPKMQSSSSLFDSLFPPSSSIGTTSTVSTRPATASTPRGNAGGFLSSGAASASRRSRLHGDTSTTQKGSTDFASADQRSADSAILARESEIDELKREISTLRYEKTENQRTIDELRRRLEGELRSHQQTLDQLNDQHRSEISDLQKRHDRERDDLRRELGKGAEVLKKMNQQETALESIGDRFTRLDDVLAILRDNLNALGSRENDVKNVVEFANAKIKTSMETFQAEKEEWQRQRDASLKRSEDELETLSRNYEREIIEGRRWLESEKEKLRIERLAFQEEQTEILSLIEQKKEELDNKKSEFLSREHDLLIRVVNEKTVLEQQRRTFEEQRNADVARLRIEAQHLEQCLVQVENTKNALLKAKRDYQIKQQQLTELKSMLVDYERTRLRNK